MKLLKNRGIFVDLLSKKEVCDMTLATFSREDMREYQGWERGLEEGKILTYAEFGLSPEEIAARVSMTVDEVKKILG